MLLDRASRLESLSSTDDVWSHVTGTLNRLGLNCLIYLTVDQNFDCPVLLTNIPQLYDGQDVRKDPFLSHCCRSYAITLTGPAYLPDYAYLPDSAKAFIKTARAVGFETGLGIPMRLQGSERFGGFAGSRVMKKSRARLTCGRSMWMMHPSGSLLHVLTE